MRLSLYLNESGSLLDSWSLDKEGISEIIKRDCKQFLRENKKGIDFYRGYKGINSSMGNLFKMRARTTRQPKDTSPDVHKWANEIFYEKFGWYPRSQGVFTSTSMGDAKMYGKVYKFFPIGNYKYVYAKNVSDSFDFLPRSFNLDKRAVARDIEQAEERIRNEYQDTGLNNISANTEVIFKCDTYYLVDDSVTLNL